MSVLIKGMEIPKNCGECPMICDYDLSRGARGKEKAENCPLVEVPNPHGRLIDADELVESMRGFSYAWGERMNDEWIGEAPTIIESEGE